MPPKPHIPDENQGSLLHVEAVPIGLGGQEIHFSEEPHFTEPIMEVDPLSEETRTADVVDRRARAELLLATLGQISRERQASGYVKYDETATGKQEFADLYDGFAPIVRSEQEYQALNSGQKARVLFRRAFLRGVNQPETIAEHDIDDEYTQFHHRYSGPGEPAKQRAKLRARLRKTLTDIHGPETIPDTYIVPVMPAFERTPEQELELLNSQQRLIAIRDDERAGFLPSHHNQKTAAFTMLTVLDPKYYPGGVHQYLQIIADHQTGVYRDKGATMREAKAEGKRSVVSILHEVGDHVTDAQRSIANLEQAKQVLDESPNPAITLAEALDDHPEIEAGFNEFIRYIDLMRLRETGEAPMPFDPLGPKRNEDITVVRDGQNKRLDDPYTGLVRPAAAAEYIEEQLNSVRVITARRQLPEIIDNEYKKLAYFTHILESVRFTYRPIAQEILASVRPDTAA